MQADFGGSSHDTRPDRTNLNTRYVRRIDHLILALQVFENRLEVVGEMFFNLLVAQEEFEARVSETRECA